MADKPSKGPGPVEQSIARLREIRYMTLGAGAVKRPKVVKPSIEVLRADIARVEKRTTKKKKSKKRGK